MFEMHAQQQHHRPCRLRSFLLGTGPRPGLGFALRVLFLGAILGGLTAAVVIHRQTLVAHNVALKAMKGVPGHRVIRAGFATAGDGGGGVPYDWSASNCAAPDDGAQVQPSVAVGTGCWIADFSGVEPSVKMWGATCDGVTTNSAPAIQAALTANPTGTMRIPAPGCRTNSTLTIGAKHIKLVGSGQQWGQALPSAVLYCRTITGDCITTTSAPASGITIEGFTIDGVGNTGGAAIVLNNAADPTINNMMFADVYDGITINGGNSIAIKRSRLELVRGAHAIKFDKDPAAGTADVLMIQHVLINCGYNAVPANTASAFVWDGAARSVNISDVHWLQCKYGVWVRNTRANASFPQYLQASGLNIEGAASNAIRYDSGSWAWITNSYLTNLPKAAQGNADTAVVHLGYAATVGAAADFWLTNSKIFAGSSECMNIDWKGVYVTNVQMRDCVSTALANTKPAVRVGATGGDVHISNSTLGAANHNYSVITTAGAGSVWLKNNDLTGNTTGPVLNSSGTLDLANQTQHFFVNVVASTTATATFPRAFASTPTVVCQQSGGAAGGAFYNTTVTTTQATIVQAVSTNQAYNCLATGY